MLDSGVDIAKRGLRSSPPAEVHEMQKVGMALHCMYCDVLLSVQKYASLPFLRLIV